MDLYRANCWPARTQEFNILPTMSDGSTRNYVTQAQLLSTTYAVIVITSLVAIARVVTRVLRPKAWGAEDILVYLAFVFYIAMSVMYIVVTPAMFRVADVTNGAIPPYATLLDDALFLTEIFFANTMIFWFVLWSVKFSLLALYKRLMDGLHNVYVKVWWAVLVFCVLVSYLKKDLPQSVD